MTPSFYAELCARCGKQIMWESNHDVVHVRDDKLCEDCQEKETRERILSKQSV